ncbi:MAG: hypothetical protein PF482_03155 [Desulfobacteraceae bacterium]|nr:hypothetical protein [Desulfobacteraceae bacterium]
MAEVALKKGPKPSKIMSGVDLSMDEDGLAEIGGQYTYFFAK